MTDLEVYFDTTQKPWGKLFYKIVWEQLSFVRNMKVLDFGSGFGITADYMAAFNEVLAIEPNNQMIEMSIKNNNYTQITDGIEAARQLPKESFDCVICHNVLEYVDDKDNYISVFNKLLKTGGKLSLIKHNHLGRIIHKAIFENNIEEALRLINGGTAVAQTFGEIKYYDFTLINKWLNTYNFKIIDTFGLRTFFALHPDNSIRDNDNWFNSMFELEMKGSRMEEFMQIAFFNHFIFEKQ